MSDNCRGIEGLDCRWVKSEFSDAHYCSKCGRRKPDDTGKSVAELLKLGLGLSEIYPQPKPLLTLNDDEVEQLRRLAHILGRRGVRILEILDRAQKRQEEQQP